MDYEMNVRYDNIDEHVYDDARSFQNSQISQEYGTKASKKGKCRIIYKYIIVVVVTALASAVTGYNVGHALTTTEQFSWSSWSHWTSCTSQQQNRTRVIPVCNENLCNYREDYATRKCEEQRGYKVDTDVRFDRFTLYKDWFISRDDLMISNVQTADTSRSRGVRFKKYKGVKSDRCVEPEEVMTFEVQYDFHITTTLTAKELVFEIGIAELDKIDKQYYVGRSEAEGFSFNVYQFGNYTRLVAAHNNTNHVIYPEFSNITMGTVKNGTLFFLIDRLSDTFSIFNHNQVLYTFTYISSTVPLCPVFGVYNPSKVDAKLRLVHTTYMELLK